MQHNYRLNAILSYAIHNPAFMRIAAPLIREDHFLSTEQHYKIIWLLIKAYYEKFGRVPSRSVVLSELSRISHSAVLSQLKTEAASLLTLYDQPASDFKDTAHGSQILQDFLADVVKRSLSKDLETAVEAPASKLPKILQEAEQKMRQVSSIAVSLPDGSVLKGLCQSDSGTVIKTRLPFIDSNMQMYTKNVNVLLGPTGGGKTILSCQILAQAALTLNADDKLHGRSQSGWFAYFGYEGLIKRPASIFTSYIAKIPRSILMNINSLDELSTTDNPAPSDKELMHRGEIPRLMGQRERIEASKDVLESYIKIFNFSGVPDETGAVYGYGGINEIVSFIDRYCNQLGIPLRLLVIDWAGMVVQRYLQSTKQQDKNIILELGRFVDNVYNKIAYPFDCSVLVVHQVRGALQRNRSVSVPISHADAAWCADFGVNASYVFCLGFKDPETNMCLLTWTKTRDGKTPPPVVCQLDGELSRFITVDDLYQYDYTVKRIVPRERSMKSRVVSVDF